MDQTADILEIRTMITDMNRCWTESWDEVRFREFIHPDAVAIVPATPGRLLGRDAYVAGWRGFVESSAINTWDERDHHIWIHPSGACAVVTYLFSISFSMAGNPVTMKGRDMFFLVKQSGMWLVIADQFSPEPPSS